MFSSCVVLLIARERNNFDEKELNYKSCAGEMCKDWANIKFTRVFCGYSVICKGKN